MTEFVPSTCCHFCDLWKNYRFFLLLDRRDRGFHIGLVPSLVSMDFSGFEALSVIIFMSHQPYRCSRKHYVFSCSSIYACMCAWLEAFSNWLGISVYLHTHTHPFSRPFSGTTQVSRYQKGKTNLDSTEARDGKCQWHPLGQMQVFTSLHTDNHATHFLQAGCPSCRPANSVKALKAWCLFTSVCIMSYMLCLQ